MTKKLALALLTISGSAILFLTGCSKDDTTPPSVSISGSSTIDLPLNSTFTDPGASATDDKDGSVTVSTSGTVNVNHTGDYTLTYTATDAAGNTGTATRTVHVYNEAETFAGNYNNCVDTCVATGNSQFNSTVTVSDSLNKHVTITNFGAFGTNVKVEAVITGKNANDAVTVDANQSLGGNAFIENTAAYASSSYVLSGASGSTSFKIKYKWSDGTASDVCTSYYIR